MDDTTRAVVDALRARRIRAMPSVAPPGWRGVSLGLTVDELERFLDTIIQRPIKEDDGLAMRIFGRPQDLTAADRPWRFDIVPGLSEFELITTHVYAHIPLEDVAEVVARLEDVEPID